jgi:hypothetical protein
MKVVCMCQGGNSRSAGCGYLLKYFYGQDALACGWEKNSPDTLKMLFAWAEVIVVMQEEFKKYVPSEYWAKLCIVDIGPDVWFNSLHPEMLQKIDGILKKGLQIGVAA